MSVSLSTFTAWLKDSTAVRCVLVEVDVKLSGGSLVTRYLSNTGYVTSATDTPANTNYSPVVSGGVKFTESVSLDGTFSLSYGDVELCNTLGDLDTWLNDYWTNRRIKIFIGDKTWIRDDFYQIFDGIVTGVDTRKRDTINLKLSDKLQRLNNPVTETKLAGSTANADKLIPLCFGECHNVEPLLVDPATHEYQVHNGAIEDIIEVRDNGVPVSVTKFLTTGKFRLASTPAGVITASVQGYVAGQNIALWSQQFENAVWTKTLTTVTANATTAPDGTTTADALVSSGAGNTFVHQQLTMAAASTTFTFSVYLKAGTYSGSVVLRVRDGASVEVGTTTVVLTSSWQRAVVTGTFTAGATANPIFYIDPSSNAAGAGETYYAWGGQVEVSPMARAYALTTTAAANIYPKTAVEQIKQIVTVYGNATTKFTTADLDLTALQTFDDANLKQVSIYLGERMNVLEACNKLADSLGARLVMSKTGLLSLVKVTLPQVTAGNTITAADMTDRSLYVSQMCPVKAAVIVAYCKNWKVQDTVALGVVENSADLFQREWLTARQTDSTAATNFNLFTEPVEEETYLIVGADASTEALRRLNVWSTQRKVLKYKGFGNLMVEKLGDPQTIQHSRFGLSGGVTGQIVGITTDWLQQKADLEVLI